MGLPARDLQAALSGRFSVICNVDIGIGKRQRSAFFQRLATLKDGLVPTPKFILVVGDGKNRSVGALDTSVGCSSHDLVVMADGNMKRRLEDIARLIEELQDTVVLDALANIGAQSTPASFSEILVMEALMILLSPSKAFHNHLPMSSVRGVSWVEARLTLATPDKLLAALAGVDEYGIPPMKVSTLEASFSVPKFTILITTSHLGQL